MTDKNDTLTVDATLDPEKATAIAQQVLRGDAGERPQIESPPDCTVELFFGLDGQPTTAEVRELTGEDEEMLAKLLAKHRNNSVAYANEVVRRATVRIGDIENPGKRLNELTVGDRDLLINKIREVTFGEEMELGVTCPQCQNRFDVIYNINSDVPVKEPGEDFKLYGEVPLRDGRTVSLRLPTIGDQEQVAQAKVQTLEERNSVMLSKVVQRIDGGPIIQPLAFVRALGLSDRRKLVDWVADRDYGPQYHEVQQECPSCSSEFPLLVSVLEFFRG